MVYVGSALIIPVWNGHEFPWQGNMAQVVLQVEEYNGLRSI